MPCKQTLCMVERVDVLGVKLHTERRRWLEVGGSGV